MALFGELDTFDAQPSWMGTLNPDTVAQIRSHMEFEHAFLMILNFRASCKAAYYFMSTYVKLADSESVSKLVTRHPWQRSNQAVELMADGKFLFYSRKATSSLCYFKFVGTWNFESRNPVTQDIKLKYNIKNIFLVSKRKKIAVTKSSSKSRAVRVSNHSPNRSPNQSPNRSPCTSAPPSPRSSERSTNGLCSPSIVINSSDKTRKPLETDVTLIAKECLRHVLPALVGISEENPSELGVKYFSACDNSQVSSFLDSLLGIFPKTKTNTNRLEDVSKV